MGWQYTVRFEQMPDGEMAARCLAEARDLGGLTIVGELSNSYDPKSGKPLFLLDFSSDVDFSSRDLARLAWAMKMDIYHQMQSVFGRSGKSIRVRFLEEGDYVILVNLGSKDAPDYVATPAPLTENARFHAGLDR